MDSFKDTFKASVTSVSLHSADSKEEEFPSNMDSKPITTVDVSAVDMESQVETQEWTPSRQIKLVVLGQMFVVFCISLDMTILTATLPTVATALNANAVESFWIAASYLLANAVVQPIMAALADIFGRRSVVFTALWLFTIGSIVCATANSVTGMLAGRTIQGIGGGGILSVNLIIISDLIPLRYRPKYISFQQLCVSIGFNIAPIIGSVLVKHTTWRWLFYINLPFCAIGLIIIPFLLKYQRDTSTVNDKLSNVDWIGSLSFIIGMTTFLIGISWGGSQYPWSSAATIVPIILGLAVVFTTGLYERYLANVTFLRLSLFATWSQICIYFCTVLQALTLFTEVYFLVLYMMTVKLYTPLQSATYLLSFSMVCVPVSGIVGPIIVRVGSYRWAVWSGWTINTLALGILIMLSPTTPVVAWVFMFLAAGIGQGLLFIAHSVASQAACQQKDASHATSMYSFMRSLGLCLGVALGGTIFQNFLQQRLDLVLDAADAEAISKAAEGFATLLRELPESAQKTAVVGAYAWAFQMLFAALCGISALGLVVSCFVGGHSLNQELETEFKLEGGSGEKSSGEESVVKSSGEESALHSRGESVLSAETEKV